MVLQLGASIVTGRLREPQPPKPRLFSRSRDSGTIC